MFIPEDWEPIYYPRSSFRGIKIGQMIDERLKADIEIGFASPSSIYSVEETDEEPREEKEIRDMSAYLYLADDSYSTKSPPVAVRTHLETVSYKLRSSRDRVWLDFAEDCIKESDSIWYRLKEYVTYFEKGNPSDIVSTLTEEEKVKEQDEDTGWTAWVGDWVIFPVMYDGYFSISSAPRNPCNHKTGPVGGG